MIRSKLIRLWMAAVAGAGVTAAVCLLPAAALASEIVDPATAPVEAYVENEWNYVDGSMDISGQIPVNAPGRLEKIRAAGKLTVATEPYFAPQEFIDPTKEGQEAYVGSDMELARLIALRMGVELEIIPMEFTQVLEAVAAGEVDLAISALVYTPGRASAMELSKAYHYDEGGSGAGLLVRKKAHITSVDDLSDKNLVAQSGSLQETLMAENIMGYHQFKRVSTTTQVFEELVSGRSDAAAVDTASAQLYLEQNPDCGLELVDGVTFMIEEKQYEGDRVAAPNGEIALIYFVNGVIDEVTEDGTYEAWYEEYLDYARQHGLE